MSQLIDNDIFLDKFSQSNLNIEKDLQYNVLQDTLRQFQYNNQFNNKIFQLVAVVQLHYMSKKCLKIIIPFSKKLFGFIDIWYHIILDCHGICLSQKIIIAKDQFLFLLKPFKKKLLALKQLNSLRNNDQRYTKIIITNQDFITIQFPKIHNNKFFGYSIKNMVKKQKNLQVPYYVQNVVKFILEDSQATLKYIFQSLTDLRLKQQISTKQKIQLSSSSRFISFKKDQSSIKKLQQQIYRFLHRSSIQLRFDYTEGSAVYDKLMDITIAEQKQIDQRIKLINSSNYFKLFCLQFYLQIQNSYTGKYYESFHLNVKQREMIKILLDIPQILPQKNNDKLYNYGNLMENKYLYNSIILQYPGDGIKFLTESGFGRLQYGRFNFWYAINNCKEKLNIYEDDTESNLINTSNDNRVRNKYFVIKSPRFVKNIQNNLIQNQKSNKFIAKNQHQLNIIKKFKGVSCIFFPRYYDIISVYYQTSSGFQKLIQSPYQNSFLIQMTTFLNHPGYSLADLMKDNKQTLTIKKVIYIMGQVAQALRFLHIHKIVHMDLKPENILILKNLLVKVIDFGQAYHPEVKYINTRPAYTYPYGCPQITQQNVERFSEKCDVFSFGIILFQLLYSKDLITTNPQILLKKFQTKDYLKLIFIVPQQNEDFGQKIIFPMLNHLILKCIQPNSRDRPSITWISVLLKYFMEMLF